MKSFEIQVASEGGDKTEKIVDKSPFLVGRDASVDLLIDSPQVSRVHLEILQEDNSIFIIDRSANGTWVEGVRLPPKRKIPWQQSDKIKIGPFTIQNMTPAVPLKRKITESLQLDSKEAALRPIKMTANETKLFIHKELLKHFDLRFVDQTSRSPSELRKEVFDKIRQLINEFEDFPSEINQVEFAQQLTNDVVGLGPLEELLTDSSITEIMVVAPDQVFVERKGRIELTDISFTSPETLMAVIERIVAPIGKRIDESSPLVDARLHDGSRVNAVIPPIALKGPCLTIRKFSTDPFGINDLINFGTLTKEMADFLRVSVAGKRNVVISGGTGSGKTTLLNVLSGFIPEKERVVTIEDSAELQLPQKHVIILESKPPNIEGKGAITIRDLVKNALRMRPDRIVVGECRGGEALDMLQAMNTGHNGSLTTIHANNPTEALSRLETMVLMSGMDLPSHAIREQIGSAINLIVQQNRFPDGSRKVTHISEILGLDEEGFMKVENVFLFEQRGYDAEGRVRGQLVPTGYIPAYVKELIEMGIQVPENIFKV